MMTPSLGTFVDGAVGAVMARLRFGFSVVLVLLGRKLVRNPVSGARAMAS